MILYIVFGFFLSVLLVSVYVGAKTSNPAVTNLSWTARPPFAHKEARFTYLWRLGVHQIPILLVEQAHNLNIIFFFLCTPHGFLFGKGFFLISSLRLPDIFGSSGFHLGTKKPDLQLSGGPCRNGRSTDRINALNDVTMTICTNKKN
jgi:hypothetical protein